MERKSYDMALKLQKRSAIVLVDGFTRAGETSSQRISRFCREGAVQGKFTVRPTNRVTAMALNGFNTEIAIDLRRVIVKLLKMVAQ